MNKVVSEGGIQIRMEPASCGMCRGRGRLLQSYETCPACKGVGSFLVAQPPLACAGCGGGGQILHQGTCEVCKGSGWGQALHAEALKELFGTAVSKDGDAPNVAGTDPKETQLTKQVRVGFESLSNDIAGSAYIVGYVFALGLNWADSNKNFLECFFYSLLSWANVGYLLARP